MIRSVPIMLLLAVGSPASAQVRSAAASPVPYYSPVEFRVMYRYQLKQLRTDLLKQQRADGGTLSVASLSHYQGRLDKLNAGFQRSVRNNNPLTVDAMGHKTGR